MSQQIPGRPPFPQFQDYPSATKNGPGSPGSLDGQMLGALHAIRAELAQMQSGVKIVQEVPSDVGGTASGNYNIGNVRGAFGSQGWLMAASVKGQRPGYRTAFVSTPYAKLFGPSAGGAKLGVIARLRYSVQDNAEFDFLFDVMPNAIVHAPCLSQNMSVEVMVTQIVFTTVELAAALALAPTWFDNPPAVMINATHSVNADGQATSTTQVRVAITEDQGLSTHPYNDVMRQISVVLSAGDTATIPIVRGAVCVEVNGPTDLVALENTNAPYNTPQSFPFYSFSLPTNIMNGTESLSVSSAGGGLVTVNFTLGF